MNCEIIKGETERTCKFEEYSKEHKAMVDCGEVAYGFMGGVPLCKEHFEYAVVMKNIDRGLIR